MRDDRVEVVGKTGTAYPVEGGAYNHARRRYAFAGFFPYSNPKYSCMALILANAGTSANRTSGQVVKNMAIKMYSRGMLNNSSNYKEERRDSKPVLTASVSDNTRGVMDAVGAKSIRRISAENTSTGNIMPNLTGYDVPSAIRTLESRGINVRLIGSGYVIGQSIPPNTPVKRGQTITLKLRI